MHEKCIALAKFIFMHVINEPHILLPGINVTGT